MTTSPLPLPRQLARRDLERLQRYRDYLDFFSGRQWLSSNRRQRRLTFNYAKAIVEKTTSYLMSELALNVEPREDSPQARDAARRAEQALDRIADDNDLDQLDFETELDAAVLGDGCYKVTWDSAAGRVRITSPDVQGVYAWWAPDDPARVWRVASRYRIDGGAGDEPDALTPLAAGARGKQPAITEVWTDAEFQLWRDDDLVEAGPNPYGFIPFVVFPNLRESKQFWGVSDVAPLVEPARELNRALTQLSAILELSGNPIAVLENIEDAQDIAVQPGAVWEVPERARAYLLDLLQGGGVQLHVSYIDLLYRALYDLGETPRTSFGDNQRALSGVALEMELHPLLQKVKRKRLIRGAVYRGRAELALRVLAQQTGEDFGPLRLNAQWGPVLPQDRSRLVADETALVRAGIHSRQLAAGLLGVADPEAEWARWREEEGGGEEQGTGASERW